MAPPGFALGDQAKPLGFDRPSAPRVASETTQKGEDLAEDGDARRSATNSPRSIVSSARSIACAVPNAVVVTTAWLADRLGDDDLVATWWQRGRRSDPKGLGSAARGRSYSFGRCVRAAVWRDRHTLSMIAMAAQDTSEGQSPQDGPSGKAVAEIGTLS